MVIIILFGGLRHYRRCVFITLYTLLELIVYLMGLIVLSNLNHKAPNLRRNLILLTINLFQIVSSFAILYLSS